MLEQPSPLTPLPSSHCSPGCKKPSPHCRKAINWSDSRCHREGACFDCTDDGCLPWHFCIRSYRSPCCHCCRHHILHQFAEFHRRKFQRCNHSGNHHCAGKQCVRNEKTIVDRQSTTTLFRLTRQYRCRRHTALLGQQCRLHKLQWCIGSCRRRLKSKNGS